MMREGGGERVTVVLLAFNEAPVIAEVVRGFHEKVVSRLPGSELLIVEDGSTDGTREILKELAGEFELTLVTGAERRGYKGAFMEGMNRAAHDLILFSDSDGQHDPDDFWAMLPFLERFDLVSGRKTPRLDSGFRLFLSGAMNRIVRMAFGAELKDINSGFKLMHRRLVDDVLGRGLVTNFVSLELVLRAGHLGYRVAEVPVRHFPRPFGPSRGLPTRMLPGAVLGLLSDLARLKREFLADPDPGSRGSEPPDPEGDR